MAQVPISASKILAHLMINRMVLISLIQENELEQKVKDILDGEISAFAFVIGHDNGPEYAVPELNHYLNEAAKSFLSQMNGE